MDTLTATIFITDKCNLRCKYCYEDKKEFKTNTKENIDKFLDILFYTPEYSKNFKSIILDFIGGEALLEWPLMEYAMVRFITLAKQHMDISWSTHFQFDTCTNGTLFGNTEIRNFLNRWQPMLSVGVSLDGCKEAHDLNRVFPDGSGSYDKIMETFDWWKKRDGAPMVKGTLSPETLPYLSKSLINQIELGMKRVWSNPIYEHEWTKEEAEIYYNELKKVVDYIFDNNLQYKVQYVGKKKIIKNLDTDENWCGSCKYMICLGLDGKLYPCHRFSTSTALPKYDIGNVIDGIDQEKVKNFMKGTEIINKQIGGKQYPLCYAQNYERHCKFEYYQSTNIMTEMEWKIFDYWMQRMWNQQFAFIK